MCLEQMTNWQLCYFCMVHRAACLPQGQDQIRVVQEELNGGAQGSSMLAPGDENAVGSLPSS